MDISKKTIRVREMKTGNSKSFSSVASFLIWVGQYPDDYFYLIVRPSGVHFYNEIFQALVIRGTTFGTGLVSETKSIGAVKDGT